MPFFIPIVISALGGLFVGSQVDNAVHSSLQPVESPSSSMPWYVSLGLVVAVIFVVYLLAKKFIK